MWQGLIPYISSGKSGNISEGFVFISFVKSRSIRSLQGLYTVTHYYKVQYRSICKDVWEGTLLVVVYTYLHEVLFSNVARTHSVARIT